MLSVFITLLFLASCATAPAEPEAEMPEAPEAAAFDLSDEPLQLDEELDSFEEERERLTQILVQQKQDQVLAAHLAELQEAADIEVFDQVLASSDDEHAAAAVVNGIEIPLLDVLLLEEQEMQQFYQMGLNPQSEEARGIRMQIRPYAVEHLISILLIEQRAAELGITASQEQIDEVYDMYLQQFGGELILESQLQQADMTIDDLKHEIFRELTIQLYLEDYLSANIDPQGLVFTDEQLRELYDQMQ